MFFQEHVSGEDGWTAISGNPVVSATHALTAIQNLQDSQILTARKHTVADEIKHIQKCLPLVTLKLPELRHRINLLIDRCELLGRTIPESLSVPTHRDFYPDQIIFTTRGLCLIDFDLFCLSDPGLDLGNFNGHLIERSLRDPAFSPIASECHNQFVEHYKRIAREREWKTVEAFTTLTLARHVYLSTLFIDRCRFTPTILDECERRLDPQLAGNYWASA
jgi:thiamine kinase-like enzyme